MGKVVQNEEWRVKRWKRIERTVEKWKSIRVDDGRCSKKRADAMQLRKQKQLFVHE